MFIKVFKNYLGFNFGLFVKLWFMSYFWGVVKYSVFD